MIRRGCASARRAISPSSERIVLMRIALQPRHDLALEPRANALPRMLARPAVIAAMMLGVRSASFAPGLCAPGRKTRLPLFPCAVGGD
jgi:hypothetical protein